MTATIHHLPSSTARTTAAQRHPQLLDLLELLEADPHLTAAQACEALSLSPAEARKAATALVTRLQTAFALSSATQLSLADRLAAAGISLKERHMALAEYLLRHPAATHKMAARHFACSPVTIKSWITSMADILHIEHKTSAVIARLASI